MIKLLPVSDSMELNDELKQIYEDSFPPDERREWLKISELIQNPSFTFYRIVDNVDLIGLITVWNFNRFSLIEHFAIRQNLRGKSLGTKVLNHVITEICKPVIVEVEEPINDTAQRRIAFYERLGFVVCSGIYFQPPYSAEKNRVKMQLMSFPKRLSTSEFSEVKSLIYRVVYKVSE
ncbi:MAG: hypothetical protein A2066_04005 [Bacteroidetes bacterium GWB2_41_8]|nr:MAG: hypothetical protein A2066_04005 [Bacteroidetes bacterium GWB2_41_8]